MAVLHPHVLDLALCLIPPCAPQLCYENCKSGTTLIAPLCYDVCPSGWQAVLLNCQVSTCLYMVCTAQAHLR